MRRITNRIPRKFIDSLGIGATITRVSCRKIAILKSFPLYYIQFYSYITSATCFLQQLSASFSLYFFAPVKIYFNSIQWIELHYINVD